MHGLKPSEPAIMTGANVGRSEVRHTPRLVAAGLLLCAAFACAAPLLAAERLGAVRERVETIRVELDRHEAALANAELPLRALGDLRDALAPLRDELHRIVLEIGPRHTTAEQRLEELGSAPPADAPLEDSVLAAQRIEQNMLFQEIDAILRQARLLTIQAEQIAARIDRDRRAAITESLFASSESVLDPALWLRAARALPAEFRIFTAQFSEWRDLARVRAGTGGILAALIASFAVISAVVLTHRVIRHRTNHRMPAPADAPVPAMRRALLAFRDAVLNSIAAPLAAFAVLEILLVFGLLASSLRAIGTGLVAAVAFFSIGRAIVRAVLAPTDPARRLPEIGDLAARRIYRLISNGVAATAALIFINAIHHELSVVPELTIATNALFSLLIALLIAQALLAHRGAVQQEDGQDLPPWIRLSGWIAVTVIAGALVAGYVPFAAFFSERLVTAAVALTALYLLLALVDALFGQGLSEDSSRGRSIAATLGLRPKTLDLAATLFAGLLRGLLILTAVVLIIGTLTISAIDLTGTLDRATWGIEFGRTRILLGDVLAAVVILLLGVILTRVLYRWLANAVLPRTEMEPSLQNSIATIVGYIGVIVAISMALGRLGLDLQNVALVAGALSVGIGFGLQSVVSNFVSGLILLTERPIRVGDWIVVGNEQGFVRKISVRSTEIETFERASVILPNSDLITGVVKNWTHSNRLGRLAIPVGVSYASDPDQVREILIAAANDHPLLLSMPEPHVLFMGFGDSSLDFELRGIVSDVGQILSTASDLRFEILRRFRAAGIEIPFPQRDVHLHTVPGTQTRPPERDNQSDGGQ
jgi:small-conductance mechanosensitive channel